MSDKPKVSTPQPQQEGYEKCTRCRHEKNLHNGGVSNYCLINDCNCQQFCARGPAALPQQEEPAQGCESVLYENHKCYLPEDHEIHHDKNRSYYHKFAPIAPLLEQEEPPNQWRRLDSEKVVLKTQLAQALTSLAAAQKEIEKYVGYNEELLAERLRNHDELGKAGKYVMEHISRAELAESKLSAMTEDRNLWQDAHNEDCPNLAKLAEAQQTIEELRGGK